MFSNKAACQLAASLCLLAVTTVAHADEKHLTLDDIDGLARQKLVDSMRKTDGGPPASQGVALNAPLTTSSTVTAPSTPPLQKLKHAGAPTKQTTPVRFVGAFSDMSGAHVLYDYLGGIYTASQGSTLLNGWTVKRVDGYQVTVSKGQRKWTGVISAPATSVSAVDGPGIQAITDLGGPLPPAAISVGAPFAASFGR